MKISPEITRLILSVMVTAQARGWIDPKTLEPALRKLVELGYASNVRQVLGETLQLLERIELEGAKPV